MILEQAADSRNSGLKPDRLELLRQRVDDENYLNAAIQRIALVLSNEIMGISREGSRYERKRRK